MFTHTIRQIIWMFYKWVNEIDQASQNTNKYQTIKKNQNRVTILKYRV